MPEPRAVDLLILAQRTCLIDFDYSCFDHGKRYSPGPRIDSGRKSVCSGRMYPCSLL